MTSVLGFGYKTNGNSDNVINVLDKIVPSQFSSMSLPSISVALGFISGFWSSQSSVYRIPISIIIQATVTSIGFDNLLILLFLQN
jgi:hypothetical protein